MSKKSLCVDQDDTYVKWVWEKGCLIINLRYYFIYMPKTKQRVLDSQMKALKAVQSTIDSAEFRAGKIL